MKEQANPPSRYQEWEIDWQGEPPAAQLTLWEDHSRSVVSTNDSPDVGFRYSVNPYRGCQHACAYCYARPTHEYLGLGAGTDFDTQLVVKRDAPALLEQHFRRRRGAPELVAFSGVTDCYQPIEAGLRLTRRCLEVCLRHRNPVAIVTKSRLVVRDRDLLQQIQQVASAQVYLSIPFADPETAAAMEPGAPRPAQRFDALRQLSEAGISTGILLGPVIPGLNDADVATLLARAAAAGARRAAFLALRLPGSTRDVFLDRLDRELPLRAARVRSRIREMRGGAWNETAFGHRMKGTGAYWQAVRQLFELHVRRLGLNQGEVEEPAPRRGPRQALLPFAGTPGKEGGA